MGTGEKEKHISEVDTGEDFLLGATKYLTTAIKVISQSNSIVKTSNCHFSI
jgi:hypothetical protein